ncbi:MAG: efflux RND transporter periplasmic adaptor subunit, partial [Pseudomonadota bacterium]
AKPLKSSGYLSESVLDQRLTAFRTAKARAASATDGLKLVSARIGEVRARRRNIEWRLSKTKLFAPVDGIVFERRARIGQQVSTATEALFRIAEDSDIELEADVEDFRMSQLKVGQSADVISAGDTRLKGKIRLISSSIDKSTRLGRIRIAIDNDADLKIGAFAQATVDIARSRGLAVPASAILYGRDGPRVQRVIDNRVVTTPVKVGLTTNGDTEIIKGLSKADRVVAKSGTFLRNGDPVRPIERVPVVSEARP